MKNNEKFKERFEVVCRRSLRLNPTIKHSYTTLHRIHVADDVTIFSNLQVAYFLRNGIYQEDVPLDDYGVSVIEQNLPYFSKEQLTKLNEGQKRIGKLPLNALIKEVKDIEHESKIQARTKGFKKSTVGLCHFEVTDEEATFKAGGSIDYTTLNWQFVYDALLIFKSAGCEVVTLYVGSDKNRPLSLVADDLQFTVMPIKFEVTNRYNN